MKLSPACVLYTVRASKIKAILCMLWPLKVGPHPTGTYKKQQPIQMGTDFTTSWSILEVGMRKLRALIIKNYYDWIFFVNKTIGSFVCCARSRRHWESWSGDLCANFLFALIYQKKTKLLHEWSKIITVQAVSSFTRNIEKYDEYVSANEKLHCVHQIHTSFKTHTKRIEKRLKPFLEGKKSNLLLKILFTKTYDKLLNFQLKCVICMQLIHVVRQILKTNNEHILSVVGI